MTIPASTAFEPRPVWARFLRRNELLTLAKKMGAEPPLIGPPTEIEMHDSVLVLEADARGQYLPHGLAEEAFRIFDEASA